MRAFLASRGLITSIGVALVAVLAVVGYVIAYQPFHERVRYCALMPDAVGLYTGNHVTVLGMPVGRVLSLAPEGGKVRVDFDVDARHRLRGTVMATTISDTVVADRSLAVTTEKGAAPWNPRSCVTTAFTPKSVTEAVSAFSKAVDEVGAPRLDGNNRPVKLLIGQVDDATRGTGPAMNALIEDLGRALRSPQAAIGRIGSLIDSLETLTGSIDANWGLIKATLLDFGPGIEMVNSVWVSVKQFAESLLILVPWLNRLSHKYGAPLMQTLDATVPILRFLSANVASLVDLVDMIPTLASAFHRSVDPKTRRPAINYRGPAVALPASTAVPLCEIVGRVVPDRCERRGGMTTADLVPLVLGVAGAR